MAFSRLSLITGIALVLLSCVQPVDLKGFVDNMPPPPVGLDIDFNAPDESPKLLWSPDQKWWTPLDRGDTVTMNLTDPRRTIEVKDQSSFTCIDWYCEASTALTATQGVRRSSNDTKSNYDWLVITPGTAPFKDAKTYQMVVAGTKDGKQYGTTVFIKVVGNSP